MESWEQNKAADIRQSGHGLKGPRAPDLVQLECPQCLKRRMLRPKGHEISKLQEELEINGVIRNVYRDICHICSEKLIRTLAQQEQEKARLAQKAVAAQVPLPPNLSLEDAL